VKTWQPGFKVCFFKCNLCRYNERLLRAAKAGGRAGRWEERAKYQHADRKPEGYGGKVGGGGCTSCIQLDPQRSKAPGFFNP
jgi:hypothetical protein